MIAAVIAMVVLFDFLIILAILAASRKMEDKHD